MRTFQHNYTSIELCASCESRDFETHNLPVDLTVSVLSESGNISANAYRASATSSSSLLIDITEASPGEPSDSSRSCTNAIVKLHTIFRHMSHQCEITKIIKYL